MVRHDFHRVDRRSTIFEQRRSALFPEVAKSVFSATRHIWNGNSFSKAEFIELTSAPLHPHQTSSCDSGCGIFTHSSPDSSALVRKRQMHCKERKQGSWENCFRVANTLILPVHCLQGPSCSTPLHLHQKKMLWKISSVMSSFLGIISQY